MTACHSKALHCVFVAVQQPEVIHLTALARKKKDMISNPLKEATYIFLENIFKILTL